MIEKNDYNYMKIIMNGISDDEENELDKEALKHILFNGILDSGKILKEEELTRRETILNDQLNQGVRSSGVFPFDFLYNIKLNEKTGCYYQAKPKLNSKYILSVLEPLLESYSEEDQKNFYELFFGEEFYKNIGDEEYKIK